MTVRFGSPGLGVSGASAGGTGDMNYTWEHPVAWTQLRKYFQQAMGEEDAKKLVAILESNAKSLEDFLDTAYLKANGGTVFGEANFAGKVNVTGYINVPPPGSITLYAGAGSAAPPGWFIADGAEKLITSHPDLYSVLTNGGTVFPYGANTNGSGGAGSTHFRLPNLAGRFPVGIDTTQTEFDTMGETGGAKTHNHNLTVNLYDAFQAFNSPAVANTAAANHLPPYMVLRYLIKY